MKLLLTTVFMFSVILGHAQTTSNAGLVKVKNGFYLSPDVENESLLVYKSISKDTIVFVKTMLIPSELDNEYNYERGFYSNNDTFWVSTKRIKEELIPNRSHIFIGPYTKINLIKSGYYIDWKDLSFKRLKLPDIYTVDKSDSDFSGLYFWGSLFFLFIVAMSANLVLWCVCRVTKTLNKIPLKVRNIIATLIAIYFMSSVYAGRHVSYPVFLNLDTIKTLIIPGIIASTIAYFLFKRYPDTIK